MSLVLRHSDKTIFHDDEAMLVLAKAFNLRISEAADRAMLDAAIFFVGQGYDEATPLFDILNVKTDRGHPMVCEWCGQLHWRPDHQEEADKRKVKKKRKK